MLLDTFYEFDVLEIPNTRVQAYVDNIIGRHPKYVYKRKFTHLTRRKKPGGYRYVADVEYFGVYEQSVKRYEDIPDGELIERTRSWFVMYDGERYDIFSWNVMVAVLWLREYLRGGKAA